MKVCLPDRVSNPGPLTYKSGALPIALRGPAKYDLKTVERAVKLQMVHPASYPAITQLWNKALSALV